MHTVKKAAKAGPDGGKARESFAALQLLHDPQVRVCVYRGCMGVHAVCMW